MNIVISYQTQHLPPPYAFATVLQFDLGDQCRATVQQEYLERDQLDEQEILAEGFSENDDFQWDGTIGNAWMKVLSTLPSYTYVSEPHEDHYIHVAIDGQPMGYPKDIQSASILVQELIQAVFEASGKEAPLDIQIHQKDSISSLEWRFADSIFLVDEKPKYWEAGRALMESIYSIDYEDIKSSKNPKGEMAIQFGDGMWYPIGSKKVIEKIKAHLT